MLDCYCKFISIEMPKVVPNEVRDVLLKVRAFFLKEKEAKTPIIPLKKVNERTSAAMGLSLRTVSRIVTEEKSLNQIEIKCEKTGKAKKINIRPEKTRRTRKDKVVIDTSALALLKQKIDEFYVKKETPSIRKLLCILKEETGYTGSREVLRQHIVKYKLLKKNIKTESKQNKLNESQVGTQNVNKTVKTSPKEHKCNEYKYEVGICQPNQSFYPANQAMYSDNQSFFYPPYQPNPSMYHSNQ